MRHFAKALTGLIALGTLCAATAAAQAGPLRFADDPGTIVLEYGHARYTLADQDPLPLLRIYGDGMVWVHYPVGTPRAGDYEFRLGARELRSLFREIRRSGLLEFDRARTLEQRKAMQARSGAAVRTSTDTDTFLRIRLERYRAHGDYDKSIVWTNVDNDAQAFPGLTAVQKLARLERRLRAMIDARPLSPVELPLALR